MANENGRFPWKAWIKEQRTEALVWGAVFASALLAFVITGNSWAGVIAIFALVYGFVSIVFTMMSVAIRKLRRRGYD